MGSGPSKAQNPEATSFYADRQVPITFSSGFIQQLSDGATDTAKAQLSLDEHVKARIQREVAKLREEERKIIEQVEAVLEKENLEKERTLPNEGTSSDRLSRQVQGIMSKIERNRVQREEIDKCVGPKQAALKECLIKNQKRPLDCQQQVREFQESVRLIEADFIKAVRA